jgi:hypothetical protein
MQTTTLSTQLPGNHALLAGAILDEYRQLLDSSPAVPPTRLEACDSQTSSCDAAPQEEPCDSQTSSCDAAPQEDTCHSQTSSCDAAPQEEPCDSQTSSCAANAGPAGTGHSAYKALGWIDLPRA